MEAYENIKQYAEACNGEYAKKISALAKKSCTAIVYGYPETENNHLYNSAQLFDNEGQSIANHRKKLLPPTADESKIFTPGTESTILSIKGIKSAIVICYELNFQSLLESSLLRELS